MHRYNFSTLTNTFTDLTMKEILTHSHVVDNAELHEADLLTIETYYSPADMTGHEYCCGWLILWLPNGISITLGNLTAIDPQCAMVDVIEDFLNHRDGMVDFGLHLDVRRKAVKIDSLSMLEPAPSSLRTELNDFVDKALDEYPSGTLVGSAFPFSKELAFVMGRHGPTMPVLPVTESRPAKVAVFGGKHVGRELKQLLIAHGLDDEIICITDAERNHCHKTSLSDALTIESDSIKAWVQSVKHLMEQDRYEHKQNQRGKHKLPPYRKGRWG